MSLSEEGIQKLDGQKTLVPQQLDAETLDDYLSSLLHVDVLFQYFRLPVSNELSHLLRKAILPILTLFLSQGKTPASQLLGLKIVSKGKRTTAFPIPMATYAFFSFALPQIYQYTKRKWLQQQQQRQQMQMQQEDTCTLNPQQLLAQERRQLVVKHFFRTMDAAVPLVRLGLLLHCWWSFGKKQSSVSPASIGLWLAGLQYVPDPTDSVATVGTQGSPLHVLYGHRRWLNTEIMRLAPILFTPLLHSASETRDLLASWIRRFLRPLQRKWSQRFATIAQSQGCPLCQQTPILVPYVTDCGHIYCYTCIWEQLHNYQNSSCKVCLKPITSCHPSTRTI